MNPITEPLYQVGWTYRTPGGRGMRYSTQVRAPSEADARARVKAVMVEDGMPMDRITVQEATLHESPPAVPATLAAIEHEADVQQAEADAMEGYGDTGAGHEDVSPSSARDLL